MDTFEILHIGPRRVHQHPLKYAIIDVCILFNSRCTFSIEYYDSRTGCKVIRHFHSYELQFKFSFINDLIPEYFFISIKNGEQGNFTVIVQNDHKVLKSTYLITPSLNEELQNFRISLEGLT
jgi:hypothetical protein